ncbi:GNAT family N-acetyltransferase [Aquimarina sp. W85]|uniref:GNAT family N-acetyltransferase n=1 Tax=Aquimarina rhodophyticola TaxID=3342246 RepID=UPI00366CE817
MIKSNATVGMTSFEKEIEGLGIIRLRPFQLNNDCEILHKWVTQPYAKYWEMQHFSLQDVQKAYADFEARDGYEMYMGTLNGTPIFLMESYVVAKDSLSSYYNCEKGDIGMHILVAPVKQPISGFTTSIFLTVMQFLFYSKKAIRVVVEPDIRNDKIHVLNKKMGFSYHKVIKLPNKEAGLAFCTESDFNKAFQEISSLQHKQ